MNTQINNRFELNCKRIVPHVMHLELIARITKDISTAKTFQSHLGLLLSSLLAKMKLQVKTTQLISMWSGKEFLLLKQNNKLNVKCTLMKLQK